MASALVDFLFPAPALPAATAIIGWWEKRRLGFNLIVGGVGAASWAASSVIGLLSGLQPLGWPAVVVFGVAANVFYLLGPTAEIALRAVFGRRILSPGPTLFRMGLTFSVGLALIPIPAAVLHGVIQVIKWVVS